MLRSSLLALCVAALATVASAQTIVINPSKSPPNMEPVRISLGINMFVPTPTGAGADLLKAQEDGRKLIYEAAAHECDVLRDVIASSCALESININAQHVPANQNFNGNKVDGYNINGNISFRVSPK